MGGRFGVGEGAVGAAGIGQGVPGAQGAEAVVRRLRMEPARQQQGAGEAMGLVRFALRALGLGVPEAAVERGVVGDERRAPGEAQQLVHDGARRRGALEHRVPDAGELLDERRHPGAAAHQALEPADDLVARTSTAATSVARAPSAGDMPVVSKSMTATVSRDGQAVRIG